MPLPLFVVLLAGGTLSSLMFLFLVFFLLFLASRARTLSILLCLDFRDWLKLIEVSLKPMRILLLCIRPGPDLHFCFIES